MATGLPTWRRSARADAADPVRRVSCSVAADLARSTTATGGRAAVDHPSGLATEAQAAIDDLPTSQRDLAMRRYVAAAALQRMAQTRIELAIGKKPLVPPAYLEELALPALECEFGRATLLELANDEERRYGYDARGTY